MTVPQPMAAPAVTSSSGVARSPVSFDCNIQKSCRFLFGILVLFPKESFKELVLSVHCIHCQGLKFEDPVWRLLSLCLLRWPLVRQWSPPFSRDLGPWRPRGSLFVTFASRKVCWEENLDLASFFMFWLSFLLMSLLMVCCLHGFVHRSNPAEFVPSPSGNASFVVTSVRFPGEMGQFIS